ncbi:MAG: ATP-binding protein [Rhizobacter sp.]
MIASDVTALPRSPGDTSWPRASWGVLGFLVCVILGFASYRMLLEMRLGDQQNSGAKRLEFFTLTLDALLTRNEVLPGVLGLERKLVAALDSRNVGTAGAANEFLSAANGLAQVSATYLMDDRGVTLAASNWDQKVSFVGRDYGFRPYFRDAIRGRMGRYYGVGVTSGEAGFFLASRIITPSGATGVITVKLTLDGFEEAMRQSGEAVLLADQDGVVFLSAVAEWKYRVLSPLSEASRERISQERQYGDTPLLPISDRAPVSSSARHVTLTRYGLQRDFSVIAQPMGPLGWQMLLLVDRQDAHRAALNGALVVALSGTLLLALAAQWDLRRRRRHDNRRSKTLLLSASADLEDHISKRTAELSDANLKLKGKVSELKLAESILRETQNKAMQAGKLAILGQMSAGMSHELNQPLTALHTLSDNAAKLLDQGRILETRDNLVLISEVAARMGRTMTTLKAFARKEAPILRRVHVASAVSQAAMLVEPRRKELGAQLNTQGVAPDLHVKADETRLGQVLVNLVRNGLDEVGGREQRNVMVSTVVSEGRIELRVSDTGAGISAEALPHLFEPFYTTKPTGQGLGLGLALSLGIIESMGGQLKARNLPVGAEFAIVLEQA